MEGDHYISDILVINKILHTASLVLIDCFVICNESGSGPARLDGHQVDRVLSMIYIHLLLWAWLESNLRACLTGIYRYNIINISISLHCLLLLVHPVLLRILPPSNTHHLHHDLPS